MIRLQRVGRKHEPVFRLVLTDSKNSPKSGKYIEILGSFDSRIGKPQIKSIEKIQDWIKKGAKLSDTVFNMFIDQKIIDGKKINKLPKKTATKAEKKEEEVKEENKKDEGAGEEKTENIDNTETEKSEEENLSTENEKGEKEGVSSEQSQ